jgi:hypothetical protein
MLKCEPRDDMKSYKFRIIIGMPDAGTPKNW